MRRFMILVVAAVVAGGVALPRARAASSTIPAVALFDDQGADRIKSDGRGAYVDSVDGVTSHFFTTLGEQDWVQFQGTQKPGRTLVFAPAPVDGSKDRGLLNAEKPIINFDDLAAVVGTRQLDSANFDTSVGTFRFDGVDGACLVWATRTSEGNQWHVSTVSPTGGACAVARLTTTSQVKGKTVIQPQGLYSLPFGVTVSLK